MNHSKNTLALAVAAALILTACGKAVEQDKGDGSAAAFNARIVDGYLAGSLVYVDSNDNGVLDAWEERAFTDRDGFVSVSAKGTNYCADGAKATDAAHCLKVRATDSLKIRARGGYDMSTGEPFNGALSVNTTRVAGSDTAKPVVVSPLTTLLLDMDAAEKQSVMTSLDVSLDTLNSDFIKLAGTSTTADQRKALTAAMQVHKIVEILSAYLTSAYAGSDSTYSGLSKNTDLPRDASGFVYAAFAELVAGANLSVNNASSDPDKIKVIIAAAQTKIKAQIAAVTKKPLISIVGDAAVLVKLDALAGHVSTLGNNTAVIFGFGGTTELSLAKISARLRAINIVVAVARDQAVDNARVQDALDAMNDGAFVTKLESDKVDLAQLVTKFKANKAAEAKTTDFSTRIAVDAALKLPDAVGSTTKLNLAEPGKGDLSMDFKTTTVDDMGKATGGTLALDIKSFEGAGTGNKLAGTEPSNVPGTWEKLNDYSLLVTIEPVPGVKQQAIVKPTLDADGVTTRYFFDYGGKQIEWKGAVPL